MPQPNAVLFYVIDIVKSSAFYSDLFNQKPTLASPFYAMFKLDHGFEFSIYDRNKLQPPAPAMSASAELSFTVTGTAALNELHQPWVQKGIRIIIPPQKMYFGSTHFMGLDPDVHRLRVETPD
ncbi:MAG: VOC family protein [candidate division FCPU426 bacterium]